MFIRSFLFYDPHLLGALIWIDIGRIPDNAVEKLYMNPSHISMQNTNISDLLKGGFTNISSYHKDMMFDGHPSKLIVIRAEGPNGEQLERKVIDVLVQNNFYTIIYDSRNFSPRIYNRIEECVQSIKFKYETL